MERFLSSVIIVCALGFTEVQAQEATTSPSTASPPSSCESLTKECRSHSLGADTKPDLCSSCESSCASARDACLQATDTDNLDTASLYSLYCKKTCKKYRKQKEKPSSSKNQ